MEMEHQRKSIGEFLRKRRSALSPKQFGMPEGHTRRRTPGLRREEVADLADVSLTWYTWLEQGREVSALPEVLERIADAMRLISAEREYLYLLTGRYALPEQDPPEHELTPAFRDWVDRTPYPFSLLERVTGSWHGIGSPATF
ncbi:transcriptional regulator with XRE-family HTH domain [Paenibacillus rhizosphaerae]|uniref:Transcriptional regulator with XRE-family HTH domain n=1 Tax=Paenibacillus rhizosphaerae TaxID=297318 RepID=A0A839TQ22_9BACL|nr:helix-turn-helix transcriptional regulator [Paenibacillus rhizosphaerae]MBB3128661.1 transcriptional regulator with XRE-family HTH domain [Paenibacillus rhizosphaerae]